jgi:ribonuclease R
MNQSDRELFLGFGIHVEGRPLLERCFDPTPARRSPLAAGEAVGDGDYVLAETDSRGTWVRERLATSGSALAAVYALAVRHGLNPVFPPRVMADADALRARPGIDDPLLADLTGLPFCTIDGPATRDLDQALHVEALVTGFRLHYALADASWFAPLGSALFAEALRRASSFYLPGLTIPMLPRVLSEDIVSLLPQVPRRALVMTLELDADGEVMRRDWVRARVRSRAKPAPRQPAASPQEKLVRNLLTAQARKSCTRPMSSSTSSSRKNRGGWETGMVSPTLIAERDRVAVSESEQHGPSAHL